MSSNKPQITNTTAALMISVALLFDAAQAVLTFFGIGLILSTFVNFIAWLTFFTWLKIKGVHFSKNWKNGLLLNGAGVAETIPVINALPAWTAIIVVFVAKNRGKEILKAASAVSGNPLGKKLIEKASEKVLA